MTVTCDLCNNADTLAVSEYLDGYDRLCSTHEAGLFEQAPIQRLFDRLCQQWQIDLAAVPVSPGNDHGE